MNDSLRTDVFVRYPPETIAVACIYLSARKLKEPLPKNPSWFEVLGVEEDDIKDCCYRMICLYNRQKSNQEELESIGIRKIPYNFTNFCAIKTKQKIVKLASINFTGSRFIPLIIFIFTSTILPYSGWTEKKIRRGKKSSEGIYQCSKHSQPIKSCF